MNPSSKLRALCVFATLAAIFAFPAHAILDTNNNGLSDLWEKQHNNGNLFPNTFLATNDEDQDGWINAKEAIAGTDPFKANPPDGIVAITITPSLVPGAFTLTWPTLIGKNYQLQVSTDLVTWTILGDPITTTQNTHSIGINTIQPDTTIPPKVFWRVIVSDLDTDTDRLTNYEEFLAGTNHLMADTDTDGVSDHYELSKLMDALFPDSDGDGVRDADELDKGTDPKSAESHPPIWLSINRSSTYSLAGSLGNRSSYSTWLSGGNFLFASLTASITQQNQRDALDTEQPFPDLPPENASDEIFWIYNYQYQIASFEARDLQESRIWIKMDHQVENDMVFHWLKLTEPNYYTTASDPLAKIEATIHEQIVSAGEHISEPADLVYSVQASTIAEQGLQTSYIELHRAPEILAVNSDFDEGRIDPVTNYAIPDCDDTSDVDQITGAGNVEMVTHAVLDHLEGRHKLNEVVTEDMHPGWFGLSPLREMPDDFWDDAQITIRKIDKIDVDTGYKESGQVRFYATWHTYGSWGNTQYYGIEPYDLATLEPKNLVEEGINGRGEGEASNVYGPDSPIPSNARFFMEGVRPGKITLEWKYKKGSLEAKFEQTFLVETRKTNSEWLTDLYYQIKLQSLDDQQRALASGNSAIAGMFPLDMNTYNASNGFFKNGNVHNYIYVQHIYYFYQQMFKQNPEKLYWAGMAKTAGASVYAGMADMHHWWHTPVIETINPGTKNALDIVLDEFLLQGNKDIFTDMGWAHRAFVASGFGAIKHVQSLQSPTDAPLTDYRAWERIYNGIATGDNSLLAQGNRDLLVREQSVVMPRLYLKMRVVNVKPHPGQSLQAFVSPPLNAAGLMNMGEAFSLNAQNPIHRVQGPRFTELVPNGQLAEFADRWAWIDNPARGMLQIWMGTATTLPAFSVTDRLQYNNALLYSAALQYSLSNELPGE